MADCVGEKLRPTAAPSPSHASSQHDRDDGHHDDEGYHHDDGYHDDDGHHHDDGKKRRKAKMEYNSTPETGDANPGEKNQEMNEKTNLRQI